MREEERGIKDTRMSVERYLQNYENLHIHGVSLSVYEIEKVVLSHMLNKLYMENIFVEYRNESIEQKKEFTQYQEDIVYIHQIRIIGSRVKGNHSKDSDLDVVIEYSGSVREDVLFNILNQNPLLIADGIVVDFNPIMGAKSGRMEEWLHSNFYLH